MSDLVGNPEDRFSSVAAQLKAVSCSPLDLYFGLCTPFCTWHVILDQTVQYNELDNVSSTMANHS